MPGTTIRRALPCSRCGYDLEGLAADGACPECGQPVVATLAARLDESEPAAPSPPIGAARLSWAVLAGAGAAFLGALVLVELAARRAIEPASVPPTVQMVLGGALAALHAAAVAGTAFGALALLVLPPLRKAVYRWRARLAGVLGFAAWSAMAVAPPTRASVAAMAVPAVLALYALAPLMRTLGPCSRRYRQARRGRQRVDELALAAAIASGAEFGALVLRRQELPRETALALEIVALAASGLLLVGLGYLVRNAVWIVCDIRNPAPGVEEILGGPDAR